MKISHLVPRFNGNTHTHTHAHTHRGWSCENNTFFLFRIGCRLLEVARIDLILQVQSGRTVKVTLPEIFLL
jgi:hypothetical protein